MSVECLLFHGISGDQPVLSKQAGAARIATELRKNGFNVQMVDFKGLPARHPTWEKIIKKFVGPDTLWVGFSTTITGEVLGIKHRPILDLDPDPMCPKPDDKEIWINEFMDLVRQQNPKIEFVHGGAGDYDFRPYGWWKFSNGTDQEIVDFSVWLRDRLQPPNFKAQDRYIVSSGFKQFSTSTIDWEKTDIIVPGQTLPIEVARGCIFKCKFCAFAYNGKTKLDYIKEANVLRDELERNYEKWGVTNYMFSDDTYNDSMEKMRMLHDQVFSKLSFKIGFTCYSRLDLLERQGEEGMELLINSGLDSVFFGIESLNPASARAIGKSGDSQRLIEFVQEFKQKAPHIIMASGFILGLPADTRDYIKQFDQWLFSNDNPLDFWLIHALTIRPPQKRLASSEFYSDIDINPRRYGYEIIDGTVLDAKNEVNPLIPYNPGINKYRADWKVNDIDLEYCSRKEYEMFKRSSELDKFRPGGFMFSTYQDLGFTKEQIRNTPLKDLVVTEEQKQQRISSYYQKLLDL